MNITQEGDDYKVLVEKNHLRDDFIIFGKWMLVALGIKGVSAEKMYNQFVKEIHERSGDRL